MRTHPIVEYYQALRDSAPCLSRAATLPKGTKLGLGKRRAPGNTIILSQPYRRRVSTDRLNREGSQLAASLEGEPGPTPAGKTLPHSFPETSRFRRERARDMYVVANPVCGHKEVPRSTGHIMVTTRYSDQQGSKSRQKVMRLYKRWHRPIAKRFIKLFLLHIESSLDLLGLLSPTHDQRSQQQIGQTRSNQF